MLTKTIKFFIVLCIDELILCNCTNRNNLSLTQINLLPLLHFPQPLNCLEPIHYRHMQVHQAYIKCAPFVFQICLYLFNSLLTIECSHNSRYRWDLAQNLCKDKKVVRVIINNEHFKGSFE